MLRLAWETQNGWPAARSVRSLVAAGVDAAAAWEPSSDDGCSAWHVAIAETHSWVEYTKRQRDGTQVVVTETLLQAITRGASRGVRSAPAAVSCVGLEHEPYGERRP